MKRKRTKRDPLRTEALSRKVKRLEEWARTVERELEFIYSALSGIVTKEYPAEPKRRGR